MSQVPPFFIAWESRPVEVVFCFHRETLVTPLIEMAVPDLVTMLLPPFHMRVGHLLHERGKIAIPLGPNDKMPMVGHQTLSAQPHPASSQRFLNDPLECPKVLVFGEKQSPAHASVEHVENHPPPENVASVVTFTAFYQDMPALSIWWPSPFSSSIPTYLEKGWQPTKTILYLSYNRSASSSPSVSISIKR